MAEHAKCPFSLTTSSSGTRPNGHFGASSYGASEFGEVMWSWEVDTAFSPDLHFAQLF